MDDSLECTTDMTKKNEEEPHVCTSVHQYLSLYGLNFHVLYENKARSFLNTAGFVHSSTYEQVRLEIVPSGEKQKARFRDRTIIINRTKQSPGSFCRHLLAHTENILYVQVNSRYNIKTIIIIIINCAPYAVKGENISLIAPKFPDKSSHLCRLGLQSVIGEENSDAE